MLSHMNFTPTKPSRVVVLGSAGFVGSHIIKEMENHETKVLKLSRKQINLLDLGSEHGLNECLRPTDALVIVSAIAPCKTIDSLIDNLKMMQVICKVLDNSKLSQVVYISSDAVYEQEGLINEATVAEPNSLHGIMHLAREKMLLNTLSKDTPLAILRPSVLFGAEDPHNGYGPNRFRRLVTDNKEIKLFGGGEEQRDHVYIEDVATLAGLCLLHRSHGVLNIATGESRSFMDVAKAVGHVASRDVKILTTERQNPITHRHFDISAIQKAFPKFTFTSFIDGLEKSFR